MKVENVNGTIWLYVPVADGNVVLRVAPPVEGFVKEPNISFQQSQGALSMEEATRVAQALEYAIGIAEKMKTKKFTDAVAEQIIAQIGKAAGA
jgi:ribosomal protein S7